MISLKNLLINTPLAEGTKKKLLKDLPDMNQDLKFELEMLCWQTLAEVTDLKFKKKKAALLREVEEGKRKYNPSDFTEEKVRLYHELATKLEHDQSREEIEEVRIKLEKHKKL